MHLGGAHLHSQLSQPAVNASAAAKRADETRKKLFAAAEEIDTAATAESVWMAGAWVGNNGQRHGGSGGESQAEHLSGGDRSAQIRPRQDSATTSQATSELALEQSAIAGSQTVAAATQSAPPSANAAYTAGKRVERTPDTRQVSYWA